MPISEIFNGDDFRFNFFFWSDFLKGIKIVNSHYLPDLIYRH